MQIGYTGKQNPLKKNLRPQNKVEPSGCWTKRHIAKIITLHLGYFVFEDDHRYKYCALTVEHNQFQFKYERDQEGRKIQLGQGAYGKVFAAVCVKTQQKLAVKEVPLTNADEQLRISELLKLSLSTLPFKNLSE